MAYVVLIGPHFTVNILSLLRRFTVEIIFIMIRVQVEVPSLETSKFSLYFSGSCISINASFRAYFPQNF